MIEYHLCCILLILLVVLILKNYFQYSETYTQKQINTPKNFIRTKVCHDNTCLCKKDMSVDMNIMLNDIGLYTKKKINFAEEQGIIEGFQEMGGLTDISDVNSTYGLFNTNIDINNNLGGNSGGSNDSSKMNNDTIISYINKDSETKLMLFYKTSCHYCTDFLPTWYKIINDLPNNILYEEINTEEDNKSNKKANSYNISTVPTIILIVNNNKKIYKGDRTYSDSEKFLKLNGINLVARTFEEFDDAGYSAEPSPTKPINKNCPAVTFDKQIDLANDVYMYQLFSDGQYGYSSGTEKSISKSVLSPFAAAYSVVDSYLNSIPNTSKMNECASLYSKDIIGLGLCDNDNLNTILSYNDKIKSGEYVSRVDGANYDSNKKVVDAIKYACDM
jgi:thiol-disulfide isomerase/thioredoxin